MEGSCAVKWCLCCPERWCWQLKTDPPEIKVAPYMSEGFYSVLGLEVGTTYQLLQRGKQAPDNSMDRWGLTAASWALIRFSMRGSDPFSSDLGLLSSRAQAMRLSIVLVLDRQFLLEAGFKCACLVLSFKVSIEKLPVPNSSGCNSPEYRCFRWKIFLTCFPF